MSVFIMAIMALYAVIGGLSTLFLLVSMPAVIGWKVYRRARFSIPLCS